MSSPRIPSPKALPMEEAECLFCCDSLRAEQIVKGSSLCSSSTTCHSHTYCRGCIKKHLTDQVNSSYHGSCKKIKCPTCPRVVAYNHWKPYVEESTQESFNARASQVLSLQCSNCHTRRSLLLPTTPEDSQSARQSIDQVLGSSTRCKAFQQIMTHYLVGDVSARETLTQFSQLLPSLMDDVQAGTTLADSLMGKVLLSISDPERRAMLHLRYLHVKPAVMTECCQKRHCFRCKTIDFHEGLTCEQYQATQVLDEVLSCPNCGVQLVKGDGCNTVTCVCGDTFNWSKILTAARFEAMIRAFLVAHPKDASLAAATMLRQPKDYETSDVEQARAWGMSNQQSLRDGRAMLFQQDHPRFTARMAVLATEKYALDHPDRILATAWAALHHGEVEAIRKENARLRALTWKALNGVHVHPVTLHAAREPQYYGMGSATKTTQYDLCFRAYCELHSDEVEVAAQRFETNCVKTCEAMFGDEETAVRVAAEVQLGRSSSRTRSLSEVQLELLEAYAGSKSAQVEEVMSSLEEPESKVVMEEMMVGQCHKEAFKTDYNNDTAMDCHHDMEVVLA